MTMHKTLHPKDNVDTLFVSRKKRGRGLAIIENCVETTIQRLEDNIEKHKGGLITTTRNDTDNTKAVARKQKSEEKQFYGRFKRLISNVLHGKTWTWLRKGNLKRETESLLITVQNNVIITNHIKARIDMTQQKCKCRLWDYRDETINHINECSKLSQKVYKTKHVWVGKVIHWDMCNKLKFNHTSK